MELPHLYLRRMSVQILRPEGDYLIFIEGIPLGFIRLWRLYVTKGIVPFFMGNSVFPKRHADKPDDLRHCRHTLSGNPQMELSEIRKVSASLRRGVTKGFGTRGIAALQNTKK
ncbi:MAG: hypothetical protein LBQ57_06620 [Spirochaetales bacterium]|jgi:hypothetical protein|nr:hypothetical protein [Spirochaetales bacterium]